MIRFQADADLHRPIVLAVKKREPAVDFATADDSELKALTDPEVLEFAANSGRILVTHDHRTMPDHFRTRIASGQSSPGVFFVAQRAPIGPIIEALLMGVDSLRGVGMAK